MKRVLLALFCVAMLDASSYALPRFALMKGDITCSGCHMNPTGGGLRLAGGESYSIDQLPTWKRGDNTFTGQISSAITLGADWRSQFLDFAQKQPVYGMQSNGLLGKLKDTTVSLNTFQAMSYAIEVGVQATKTLSGYFRFDPITPTAPEAYAMLQIVHPSGELIESGDAVNNLYVKFGAFLPAFGIRFDDHSTYVKGGDASVSGFGGAGMFWTYAYRDVGAELGLYMFDHVSLNVGVYNGNEVSEGQNFATTNPNKAIAARLNVSGEIVEDVLSGEIGGSIYTHQLTDPTGADNGTLSLAAIHGGLRAGPVSILAEYDNGKNVNEANSSGYYPSANALAIEGTVHLTKGLDGLLRYEQYENEDAAGNVLTQVKNRITIGGQWFPIRFLEVRPEFRIANMTTPSNADPGAIDALTQTTFLVQIHLFF